MSWALQSEKARQAAERGTVAAPAVQMFLPGLEDFMRAMPNHLARSSLFAPVALGRKKIHKGAVLVSRADAVIKFWGEQLDEAQADVWMQAMHEAGKHLLGEQVTVNRAKFLRKIGRHTGKNDYQWLHRTMVALTFAMLVIEVQKGGKPKLAIGKTRALHLIDGWEYDDQAENYTLRIDPRWHGMFANREFALVDWDKRLQIRRGQDMAKALQRLVATSADMVQRYPLHWLKGKLEYTGRDRDFEEALMRAMCELERLEIIAGGRIGAGSKGQPLAVWTKL